MIMSLLLKIFSFGIKPKFHKGALKTPPNPSAFWSHFLPFSLTHMVLASVVSLMFCEYNQHASTSKPLHLLLCFFCLGWSSLDIYIICSLISLTSLFHCLPIKKDFSNVSILYHYHLALFFLIGIHCYLTLSIYLYPTITTITRTVDP